MARLRQRRRAGRIVLRVEIDSALIEDLLLAGGLLAPGELDDRRKVEAATARQLENLAAMAAMYRSQ